MTNLTREYYPYPMGVRMIEENGRRGLIASFPSDREDCGIVLFDRKSKEELGRYPFSPKQKIGRVFYQTILNIEPKNVSYLFYVGEKLFADKRARAFDGTDCFGTIKGEADYKAILDVKFYDWGEDMRPMHPYEDCIAYCLHVRGFTKHSTSGVKGKGTYAGIIEKIPYLKELGITTLELQPTYEFNEMAISESGDKNNKNILEKQEESKINYWGYKEAFYYTPKRGYAKSADAVKEYKDMVKALHENGLEVVMQFYFPDNMAHAEVLEILRFWRIVYHIDGFHLMGNGLPIKEVAEDAYLQDCKLWYYNFPVNELYSDGKALVYRNLAAYNDAFLYNVRRLLKGDEGMIYDVMKQMRTNPATNGVINYLTNYYGFTMMDMVSYEQKNNLDNGEENRDGMDYNCSWNCGVEGPSRKKQIMFLREKQLKNAFTFLMLSQGTPLFFMGDEFGNSQKGNNNPYCQDNEITWLNWRDLNKNRDVFTYVKDLIAFRKNHRMFHLSKECMLMDYKSCGYPDLSYHGKEAWKPSWEHYSRQIGWMLCGEYSPEEKGRFYYIAMNMHWEERGFALPKLPKGKKWSCAISTAAENLNMSENEVDVFFAIAPRSIAVLVAE